MGFVSSVGFFFNVNYHTMGRHSSWWQFAYRDFQSATKNFSQKLGGSRLGFVFKGILQDSTTIAVKKLENIDWGQGEEQFRILVGAVGTIQHVNLVWLDGFRSEGRGCCFMTACPMELWRPSFQKKWAGHIGLESKTKNSIGKARWIAYLRRNCRDILRYSLW